VKVLHVIPAVAPRYGGPSAAIAPMCRNLVAEGVEPTIVATDADGEARLDVPIGEPTRWNGVPAVFFRRDWNESYKYSRGLARWVAEHVVDYAVVHVHAVLSHAPLAAARACRRAGVPYVVRPLGTLDPWSLGQKALKKRALLAMAGRRMLEGAAAIHYTTAEEQTAVERALGLSRGVVIPLGVDADAFADALMPAGARHADPYILVIARLHAKKNLETLIEAFAGAAAAAAWRLVIAGDGDREYVAGLRQLASRLHVDSRVEFAGWVDGDAKRLLLRNAAVFALPSRQENFGISVLEALAAGVPVLVSPQVNLASAIEAAGAGWVVDGDIAPIRAAIERALADPRDREARGCAARQLAQHYTWPHIAKELAAMYRRVVQPAPAREVVLASNF
jgi:glycosyltransferase involved in cell wall biosynthesis